jgi:15-cis-phytoene synthase
VTEAEQITAASRSNLALAFVALPKERRQDISTFYAFCRVVDDIADGSGSRDAKTEALDRWRVAITGPVSGESSLATPVREIIRKYAIPPEHFREIIAGVAMDLDGARYATWDDLRLYCHRVASVVGLVSIRIFGTTDPRAETYALNLGLALQLTNILRDVGQDYANEQRIYLPADDLARFGVTEKDIAEGRRSEAFLALMDHEAERAESLYRAAVLPEADRKALGASEIMRAVYYRLLHKMRRDRWKVFDRRYRLSKPMKLWLVLTGILRARKWSAK